MKLQKEDGYYYLMEEGNDIAIATTDQSFIDELGAMKLSKENCDEIFGVVDVEKLADEYIVIKPKHREHEHNLAVSAYIEGFKKAMELNKDKLFTVEDVKKAIYMSNHVRYAAFSIDEIIQSLQQPTEIKVEIEMEYQGFEVDGKIKESYLPKLDENGCLILTKKK